MALIAFAQGDLIGAMDGYRRALEPSPERVDLMLELGWVNLDLGLLDQARTHFDQAISASPPAQPFARTQKNFWYVASGDIPALAQPLRGEVVTDIMDTEVALDLGLLSVVSGDLPRAQLLARRGIELTTSTPQVLRNPYRIRWGRSSQLTLALIALRSGDSKQGQQRLAALLEHLDQLEREGHVWHGLEYLRASAHALRGDSKAALAALEDAYRLGWRRAWWMRADPCFDVMRGQPAFQEIIARIEDDTRVQRARHAAAMASSSSLR